MTVNSTNTSLFPMTQACEGKLEYYLHGMHVGRWNMQSYL
jgi:hypothetical protein